MNLVNPYVFALPIDLSTNTYIGGVASTISTANALATKLAIDVSRINNFSILGSDIKCKITGSYALPNSCFNSNVNITSFVDIDNLINEIGDSAFRTTTKIKYIELGGVLVVRANAFNSSSIEYVVLKNCVTITDASFYAAKNIVYVYLPIITSLGSTNGTINGAEVFGQASPKVYLPVYFATNNAGAKDGDLTSPVMPVYIDNLTVPSPVTTLTVSTVYNTAIKLSFTAPSSTNAIDYYEVYVNGALNNRCDFGSVVAKGLTESTNYNIKVLAVDIYFNKSTVSNILSASTNTTSYINSTIISAYGLSNGVDAKNGYNGTVGSSITYVPGLNGNASNFNATSNAYISIADNNNFSFTNGTNDLPFSVSFKLKLTANGIGFLVSKSSNGFANNAGEWNIYNSSGKIIVLFSNKTSGYLASEFSTSLTTGVWYDIVMTYSGSGVNAGIELYVNGVSKPYTSINSGLYIGMSNTPSTVNLGQEKSGAGLYLLNGVLDEVYIFNAELAQTDATLLQSIYYPF